MGPGPDTVLVLTPHGAVLHASPAFYTWTGYREDEVVDKPLTEVVLVAATPDLPTAMEHARDTAIQTRSEWLVRLRSQQAVPVLCELRLLDGPQPVLFFAARLSEVAFPEDAAERHSSPTIRSRASSPLSGFSPWSRSAGDAVPYAIADGENCTRPLLFVSPGFAALTGHSLSDSCGRPCQFLTGPLTGPRAATQLERALHSRGTVRFSLTCHRRSGEPFESRLCVTELAAQEARCSAVLVVLFETPLSAAAQSNVVPPTFVKVRRWRPNFRLPAFGWVGVAALCTCLIIAIVAGTTTQTALCLEANGLAKVQSTVACGLSVEAVGRSLDEMAQTVAAEYSFASRFFSTPHPTRFEGDYARFAVALAAPSNPLAIAWVSDDSRAIVVLRDDPSTVLCSTVFKETNYTAVNGSITPYHKTLCNAVRVAGDERLAGDVDGVALLALMTPVGGAAGEVGVVVAAADPTSIGPVLAATAGPSEAVYALLGGQLFAVGRTALDGSVQPVPLTEDATLNGRYYAVQTLEHPSNLTLTIVHVTRVLGACPNEDMPVIYGCLAGLFVFVGLGFTVVVLVAVLRALGAVNGAMQQVGALRLTRADEALQLVPALLVAEPRRLQKAATHFVGGLRLLLDTATTPQWPYTLPAAEGMAGSCSPFTTSLGPPGLASFVVPLQRWFQPELTPGTAAVMACRLQGLPLDCSSDVLLEVYAAFMHAVTAAVLGNGGVAHHCEGPHVLAVWGSSVFAPNPALPACQAALEVVRGVRQLNMVHSSCWSRPLSVHIGVAKGPVLTGPLGGTALTAHTVLGAAVPLAEGLRRLNGLLGTRVLLGSDAAEADLSLRFETRVVDWVEHRHSLGNTVCVHEIRRALDGGGDPCWMYSVPWDTVPPPYSDAVRSLQNGNAREARDLLAAFLQQQPHDRPARLLLWAIGRGAQGGGHALHPLEAWPCHR
eukprot:EG_transcript_1956